MITQLENNKKKIVFYYQPDTLQTNEIYKVNFTMKNLQETFGKVVVSPLHLVNKLGICFQLLDSPIVNGIQSNIPWPDLTAKSPLGLSMLLVKTQIDLPYQPQEIRFDYDYSGDMNLILCADCLETCAIITIYKGRDF